MGQFMSKLKFWLIFSYRYIKMSSPNLNDLIIIGCILVYISGILLGMKKEESSIGCQVINDISNQNEIGFKNPNVIHHVTMNQVRKRKVWTWLCLEVKNTKLKLTKLLITLKKQQKFCDARLPVVYPWNKVLMTCHYQDLSSASDWLNCRGTTNQKHYADLGSDTSSVWNFCSRSSHFIFTGNQWWRRKI